MSIMYQKKPSALREKIVTPCRGPLNNSQAVLNWDFFLPIQFLPGQLFSISSCPAAVSYENLTGGNCSCQYPLKCCLLWTGEQQKDVAHCTKTGEKCYHQLPQDKHFIMKWTPNIAKLSYQNLIASGQNIACFHLNHQDVYLFLSESHSTSLGVQMRKEQIKTGSVELIAGRKSHLPAAGLSSWSFNPLALRTTTVRRPR